MNATVVREKTEKTVEIVVGPDRRFIPGGLWDDAVLFVVRDGVPVRIKRDASDALPGETVLFVRQLEGG